jgi:hypothetical protein
MKTYEAEHEFISRVLMGNQWAIRMANELFFVSQVWDDLVDGDRPVPHDTINRMMWTALVDLPLNPFYQENFAALHPIIRACIIDWFAANDIEKDHEHDRQLTISYILRDSISNILVHMALLVGGYDWMRQVAPEIRKRVHDESLGKYIMGVKKGVKA